MKNWLLLVLLVPFLVNAQKDVSGIPIPMKKGIVFYENSYSLDGTAGGAKGQELYAKALDWFAQTFPGDHGPAGKGGSITRTETFKVLTGDTSVNYYYITVTMHVDVKKGGYAFQVYNFYEKPIQKGITNDYSKIEYRWRDFRQGKPWFNTDRALFTGLNAQTLAYMDSFHKEMASL